jgi:hypothetical protein
MKAKHHCSVMRKVLSGPVSMLEIAIGAGFPIFPEQSGRISLPSRLSGGEGWIRTLGTGLNGARSDVCVSCRESTFYPETEGRVVLRHYGKPMRFPV